MCRHDFNEFYLGKEQERNAQGSGSEGGFDDDDDDDEYDDQSGDDYGREV